MKNIAILTLCMVVFACFASDGEKKFPGWGCKDVALLKEAAANPDTAAYRGSWRVQFDLMAAEIEAPDTVDTLAKIEAFVASARAKYIAKSPVFEKQLQPYTVQLIVLQYMRCRGDKRFVREFMASDAYTKLPYYQTYCVLDGYVPVSDEERKAAACELFGVQAKARNSAMAKKCLEIYIDLSIDDDDEAVVKNLRKFYRLALPRLTAATDDPWKPVVAKIQLALKSRGAEVK